MMIKRIFSMLRILVITLILIAAVHSGNVFAIGLGQPALHSLLNQPLNLTIDVLDAKNFKPEQIIPNLGSANDFDRAKKARPHFLNKLKFTTIKHDGKLQIKVSSEGPVNEPLINFLLEIKWPKGRVLREYTILLDPPAFGTREVADEEQPLKENNSTETASKDSILNQQTYTVKPNDSLWDIASQFSANNIMPEQMMSAIQKANPHAFMQDNPDKLKKGALLNIPAKHKTINTENTAKKFDETDTLIKIQHQQLEQLSSENIKLLEKLEQLEAQIDVLDNVIANQTENKPDKITETRQQKPPVLTTQKEYAKQLPAPTTIENINNLLLSKPANEPAATDRSDPDSSEEIKEYSLLQDKQPIPPAIKNKPTPDVINAKIEQKHTAEPQPWYATLFNDFNHFLLLSAGAILILLLGWLFEKKRKQRKEEEDMNNLLEAEALEEENNRKNTQENPSEQPQTQNLSADATTFSELISDPSSSESISAKPAAEEKQSDQQQDNNTSQNVEAEEESESTTPELNIQEDNIEFSTTPDNESAPDKTSEESIASELTLDLEEDGILTDDISDEKPEDQSQKIADDNEAATTENVSIDKQPAPEPEIKANDTDLSAQLEQLDEELNTLSEEFSFAEDAEDADENEEAPVETNLTQESKDEDEGILSLLDLARAYLEMDDKDEAAAILKRVINKGDETEKAEAEELLKRCQQ